MIFGKSGQHLIPLRSQEVPQVPRMVQQILSRSEQHWLNCMSSGAAQAAIPDGRSSLGESVSPASAGIRGQYDGSFCVCRSNTCCKGAADTRKCSTHFTDHSEHQQMATKTTRVPNVLLQRVSLPLPAADLPEAPRQDPNHSDQSVASTAWYRAGCL